MGLSRSSSSSSSHLTREQQGLLNFDEIVAIWYFCLVIWYSFYRCWNWKVMTGQRRRIHPSSSGTFGQYGFSPIHWLITSIALMGLANFLFSVSLLEAMDHKTSIGSKVRKLSYANMFFACLRHPCTLSLGVLAPKVAFGSDRYYYFPSQSTAGGETFKSTAMCLAAIACTQTLLKLTGNLMVLFRYSVMDSQTVKLADSFQYVLDGILLVWMIKVLYEITVEISRDEYRGRSRWQAWWKSQSLLFFWVLYTLFVTVSAVLIVFGMAAFLGAKSFQDEHFVYASYKAHVSIDLLLVTGIAFVLRPKPLGQSPNVLVAGGEDGDSDIDYALLLAESQEEEDRDEEEEVTFEMSAPASHSVSTPLT